MKKLLTVLVLLGIAGLVGLYIIYCEGQEPLVSLTPATGSVTSKTPILLSLRDQKSGLAAVSVRVRQDQKEVVVLDERIEGAPRAWEKSLTLEGLGFKDGDVEVITLATDRSFNHWGKGNTAMHQMQLILDDTPPIVSVLSHQHYLNQGGSGVVVFNLSEQVFRIGVGVDEHFFPAYQQPSGAYICFFAFPFDLDPTEHHPLITAEDAAGNISRAGFYHLVNPRRFKHDNINLSDTFLNAKMPQFQNDFPGTTDPLQIFLKVNRDMRKANREALKDIGRDTDPSPHWNGVFGRMTNAAPMAGFADHRSYLYKGEKVDEQTHLGIDLASVAQAEVEAANAGRVVYTGFMGIYGQCVIIDHGAGLQTLYAHLSSIGVNTGDVVTKGQHIGNTGATGMAGGDHLHYAVLISGIPVNPIEWWDPTWIKNNITSKLSLLDN